ncbi:uncharacterized protein LOC126709572 isoform X2 [Quercus robur]|uniref:uncharacterized protein LOC126709572 isoform X2 n=1 Tax=Quercus robur TaxID=38942 RepID=UPI002161845B|nr:uncharacterized protein LOC126709572 isoform X2 [Quercus robur]
MDDHNNNKALFKEVFGDSSDSDDNEQQTQQPQLELEEEEDHQNPSWEQIKEIKGLWLCRDFLSPRQQSSLVSAILNEGWFTEPSHNQAMRFGDLPAWSSEISNSIRELVLLCDPASDPVDLGTYDEAKEACPFPSDLLRREPLFDQLIVNVYQPGYQCTC